MLIIAAIISHSYRHESSGEADFADVFIIMFVVVLNSVLGVVQEYPGRKVPACGAAGDEVLLSPR